MPGLTNILNNQPFRDVVLQSTVSRFEKEIPEVTYYTTAAAATNPTTTPVTLLTYAVESAPPDRPYEVTIEAFVKITSNLSGDQEFTFDLYDTDDAAAPISLGAIDIPDALNTAIGVKVDLTFRTTNSGSQHIIFGELSLFSIDSGATTSVVMPTNRIAETAEDAIQNFTLRVTAETGTATTTIQLLSAKVVLDRQVWD